VTKSQQRRDKALRSGAKGAQGKLVAQPRSGQAAAESAITEERAPQRSTSRPRWVGVGGGARPSVDDGVSSLDRILDRATHPGPFTIGVILAAVVIGTGWPQYVVDPTLVGGQAHEVVAYLIAAVLFLSFSTLSLLAYSLVLGNASTASKKFAAAVLNRAGIGAALGILLGVRLAPALLDPRSPHKVPFPEYLSDVGNAVTVLTLVLISTMWGYAVGPFRQVVIDSLERLPFRTSLPIRKVIAFLIISAVNLPGIYLAQAVLFALIRP
jgi:hypothetical protein